MYLGLYEVTCQLIPVVNMTKDDKSIYRDENNEVKPPGSFEWKSVRLPFVF